MEINLSGNLRSNDLKKKVKKNSLFNLNRKRPEEVKPTQENPFGGQRVDPNMPSFNNNILSEESQTMNSLLSDSNVPLDTKRKHWWIFGRDNSLTFLDKERKAAKLLNFDIIKIDTLNALPWYDYTFEVEKELNVIRNVYETKLDRSLGTDKATHLNERIAQKSQFNENRAITKDESQSSSGGFISKLLNRR